jgi:hypothetical protein
MTGHLLSQKLINSIKYIGHFYSTKYSERKNKWNQIKMLMN